MPPPPPPPPSRLPMLLVALAAAIATTGLAARVVMKHLATPEVEAPVEAPDTPLAALELQAAEPGCPRRLAMSDTSAPAAPPAGWLPDHAGWERAESPDRAPTTRLVYFGSPACPYSLAAERDVLGAPAFQKRTRDYVRVHVNPEHGAAEAALADRFAVKAYPTLVVVRVDGSSERVEIARDVDGTTVIVPVEQVLTTLDALVSAPGGGAPRGP